MKIVLLLLFTKEGNIAKEFNRKRVSFFVIR